MIRSAPRTRAASRQAAKAGRLAWISAKTASSTRSSIPQIMARCEAGFEGHQQDAPSTAGFPPRAGSVGDDDLVKRGVKTSGRRRPAARPTRLGAFDDPPLHPPGNGRDLGAADALQDLVRDRGACG